METSKSHANVIERKKLPKSQKFFYGIGHVFNDLTASCWFSYTLIFMTKIIGVSEANAGLVLLSGQASDGICTLIIGYLSDRTKLSFYGKRKFWHLIGIIASAISFPFLFNLCLGCEDSNSNLQMVYYSWFGIMLQAGFASTENSHLALIPEISTKQSETVELNAIRSGFTFASGIFVFGVAWILLGSANGTHVTKELSKQFMILSFVVVVVGLFFSIIFHVGIKEPRTKKENKEINHENGTNQNEMSNNVKSEESNQKTRIQWLKTPALYKCTALYLVTRLGIIIFQSYFNLYLTDTLEFNKEAIAYFPLILLVAASLTSILLKFVTKRIGGQITYTIGASLIIISSVWLYSASKEHRNSVYGAAALGGCGSSIILVTALTKSAELIGTNKKSGAFVYSIISFADKMSSGIAIFVIQELKPIPDASGECASCSIFSKVIQSVIPGTCALIGLLLILFAFPSDFNWCRTDTKDIKGRTKEQVCEANEAYEDDQVEEKENKRTFA